MSPANDARGRAALVIGGTGPTGPSVVHGLIERGYHVAMLHTGRHEEESIPRDVEHLHTDPFDREALSAALSDREFDVAVVMYGRLRAIAEILEDRVGRFISVGGVPAHAGFGDPASMPTGALAVPGRESGPRASQDHPNRKVSLIVRSEDAVFRHHPRAFHFRFPLIYGPRQLMAREWMIVKRVLDGRKRIILPDGGGALMSIAYSENAAHALLCAVDQPTDSQHGLYNVADEWTPTLRQWVTITANALDHSFEIVDIPFQFASIAWPLLGMNDPYHRVFTVDKAIYQLNYRDVVPVPEALARTARWLVENPPHAGQSVDTGDRFDYVGEDTLIKAWRQSVKGLSTLARGMETAATLGTRYAPDFDESAQKSSDWVMLSRNSWRTAAERAEDRPRPDPAGMRSAQGDSGVARRR